jgi:hypothetical protein
MCILDWAVTVSAKTAAFSAAVFAACEPSFVAAFAKPANMLDRFVSPISQAKDMQRLAWPIGCDVLWACWAPEESIVVVQANNLTP